MTMSREEIEALSNLSVAAKQLQRALEAAERLDAGSADNEDRSLAIGVPASRFAVTDAFEAWSYYRAFARDG